MTTSKSASTSLSSAEFTEAVLRLKPRLAAFDCDGTLWSGDAGEGFFNWQLERRMVSDEIARWVRGRYADYRAGQVSEDDMCGEMATMNRGLTESAIRQASREYFDEHIAPQIFPEMRDLVRDLKKSGCDVWAVSSTSEWVIREGLRHFDIPAERILAVEVAIENKTVGDRLLRVPSGEGKAIAIREVVGQVPDAAFGNSRWDTEMLKMAKHAFAVNPNPDLEQTAREMGWTIYFPASVRR